VDDVTQRNMELIKRLERSQCFDQVWYFNCGIYGRTENGFTGTIFAKSAVKFSINCITLLFFLYLKHNYIYDIKYLIQ
jgi:hypothetical protein